MATYLKFLDLTDAPFERPTGGRFVLATDALRRTYAEVRRGIDEDSPRICVSGGEGIGKSSLAAALPKLLGDSFRCVLIRDPAMTWPRMKAVLIKKLGLAGGQLSRRTLEQARVESGRIVLVIDQAEKTEAESLEHLDTILGYKDERGEQIVQCVLLANLESAPRGSDVPLLWWLDRLTTLQLQFSAIPEKGIRAYVDKHLKKAGWSGDSLFTDDAIVAIHRYTGGIPGTVGALCEELLARAAERRVTKIDVELVRAQCEPDSVGDFAPRDVPHDPRREPMLAQPPDEGPTAWPELGPPADEPEPDPEPEPAPAPVEAEPPPEREPELKVEQGFVPMEDPTRSENELDDFHVRGSEPAWGAGARVMLPTRVPERRGIGRVLRLLIAAAALFAAAYLYWPEDAPIPRPALLPRIPPPEPEPVVLSPHDTSLTDDLRVPDTSASKPRAESRRPSAMQVETTGSTAGALSGAATSAGERDGAETIGQATEESSAGEAGAPTFEPWADQEPQAADQ